MTFGLPPITEVLSALRNRMSNMPTNFHYKVAVCVNHIRCRWKINDMFCNHGICVGQVCPSPGRDTSPVFASVFSPDLETIPEYEAVCRKLCEQGMFVSVSTDHLSRGEGVVSCEGKLVYVRGFNYAAQLVGYFQNGAANNLVVYTPAWYDFKHARVVLGQKQPTEDIEYIEIERTRRQEHDE